MGYKSRGNYSLGSNLSQERWNEIFSNKFKRCGCDNGKILVGISLTGKEIYEECFNCKGTGKIKNDNNESKNS